ncbi:MAG TPA: hypothetical protein EYN06_08545 [Myxococcales bacterium]|nr:hypothetical protein [Myxococcales bacterium]HIN86515.1 hypothetical protein [Myxococcales bacterium]
MSDSKPALHKTGSPQEQQAARELAEKSGVPLWGAYRVIRGEITLNQLLKSMMRREKFRKLQSQDGLDSDLAGHVANDTLPIWRAKMLQEMRGAGRSKFSRDRIAIAHSQKLAISMWCFGSEEWETGHIIRCRTYDFDFRSEQGKNSKYFKHDIKLLCHPDDLKGIQALSDVSTGIVDLGLKASKSRDDRYRPSDQQLEQAKLHGKAIKWVFRDGTMITGAVFAFGRWDLDLISRGSSATLFFHALHPETKKQLVD